MEILLTFALDCYVIMGILICCSDSICAIIKKEAVFSISIHLHAKLKMSLFFLPLNRTLKCVCATTSLSILLLRGT